MRSDDLVPLIAAQPAPGVGFRQGRILAWNPITCENTVDVGGATLTNLPILNTAEAGILLPGDVVALLTTGQGAQSWWILGRVTIPGTAQAGTAISAWGSRGKLATANALIQPNSTSFTAFADGPTITDFIVGNSGSALVFITGELGTPSSSQVVSDVKGVFMGFDLSGPTPVAPDISRSLEINVSWSSVDAIAMGAVSNSSKMVPLTGLLPGTYTIDARYRIGGSGNAAVTMRGLFAVPL